MVNNVLEREWLIQMLFLDFYSLMTMFGTWPKTIIKKNKHNKQHQYFPTVVFHPGETIAEKLEEMQMGRKEFSLRTGKPEKTIIAVLKRKSAITPDMSVQFENVTKIPAHFWMNHQRSYDEFIAREKRKITIDSAWQKRHFLRKHIVFR